MKKHLWNMSSGAFGLIFECVWWGTSVLSKNTSLEITFFKILQRVSQMLWSKPDVVNIIATIS